MSKSDNSDDMKAKFREALAKKKTKKKLKVKKKLKMKQKKLKT